MKSRLVSISTNLQSFQQARFLTHCNNLDEGASQPLAALIKIQLCAASSGDLFYGIGLWRAATGLLFAVLHEQENKCT